MSGRARKLVGFGGLTLVGWATVVFAATASAEQVCRTTTVSWSTPSSSSLYMTPWHYPTYDTGLAVAPGDAAETVVISASSYRSADRHADDTYPTREDDAQRNERWRLRIGGADFGVLTDDLPDSVAEGAPTPWYSGEVTGSLGTGTVTPGPIVIVHGSQYGYTESANSVRPQSFSLTVTYCRAPDEAPTTNPATTNPATTNPATTNPATAEQTTTTSVPPPTMGTELPPPMTAETTTPPPPASTAPTATVPGAVGPPPSVRPLPDPVPLPPTSSTTAAPPTTVPSTSTTTTTPPTSTTVAVAGPEPSPPTSPVAPPSGGGRLPTTGSDIAGWLIVAVVSATFGALLWLAGRRSRPPLAR